MSCNSRLYPGSGGTDSGIIDSIRSGRLWQGLGAIFLKTRLRNGVIWGLGRGSSRVQDGGLVELGESLIAVSGLGNQSLKGRYIDVDC